MSPPGIIHVWNRPPGDHWFPEGLTHCGMEPVFAAVKLTEKSKAKIYRRPGYGKGFRFCKKCIQKERTK